MKYGGTGTQYAVTPHQRTALLRLVLAMAALPMGHPDRPTEFHQGDCINADQLMNDMFKIHMPEVKRVSHPPDINTKRAFCDVHESRQPRPYLTRNKDIGREIDRLIAIPSTANYRPHSGTWHTFNFVSKELHKPNVKITPQGQLIYQYDWPSELILKGVNDPEIELEGDKVIPNRFDVYK